jgi:hypothetical protein
MTRVFYLILILLLFPVAYSYFCCKDPSTGLEKCYATGQCCNGFWYPSCFDFDAWVHGEGLAVGVQSTVYVYVRNKGAHPDKYNIIDYQYDRDKVIVSIRDTQLSLQPKETRAFLPTVILLSNTPTTITFTIKSDSNIQKTIWATLSAGSMYSMPDLSLLSLLLIPIAAAFIYRKL